MGPSVRQAVLLRRSAYRFLNAEAATYVAAMLVQPNNARKSAIDTYVAALKAAGVWTALDAIYLYGAHTQQAGLLNVKTPGTRDSTLVDGGSGAPSFVADRGFTTNGVDNYIDTNFNPTTGGNGYVQNSNCFGVRLATETTVGNVAGWSDGSDAILVGPRNASDVVSVQANATSGTSGVASSATTALVLTMLNRSGSTAVQIYRNGTAVSLATGGTTTSQALNNHNLYAGRILTATFRVAQFFSLYAGTGLNSTFHGNLAAADLAYAQAVGAA